MSNAVPAKKLNRIQQLRETYRMARRTDKWIGVLTLGAFLLGVAVGVALFWFLPGQGVIRWVLMGVGAVMIGVMAALIVFGRRAQGAMYTQMEGQVGAAAGALQVLGKIWKVFPAIGFNKQQDVIHRVVGPRQRKPERNRRLCLGAGPDGNGPLRGGQFLHREQHHSARDLR